MASRRRLSISFCGLPEDDAELLEEHDANFYGSDGSSAESEGDDEPAAERRYSSAADAQSSDEQSASDVESASDEDDESTARGIISTKLRDLRNIGCGCRRKNHCEDIAEDDLEECMYSLSKSRKREKKIFVMGELSCGLQRSTAASKRQQFTYQVLGHKVCRSAFQETHDLSHHTLRTLQEFVEAGLTAPPAHKSKGKAAKHAVPSDVKESITMFLRNYASIHGMPQPAAPRGPRGLPPTYLPATLSVVSVHKVFMEANPEAGVSYETF